MNAKYDIDTRIDRICAVYQTTADEMHTLGKSLLTLFRDVYRSTKLDAVDMEGRLCSYSDEQDEERKRWEALVRLEFFATEFERRKYEAEINSIPITTMKCLPRNRQKAQISSERIQAQEKSCAKGNSTLSKTRKDCDRLTQKKRSSVFSKAAPDTFVLMR